MLRTFANAESKVRDHGFPSAAFGRNQEEGKKIKGAKKSPFEIAEHNSSPLRECVMPIESALFQNN